MSFELVAHAGPCPEVPGGPRSAQHSSWCTLCGSRPWRCECDACARIDRTCYGDLWFRAMAKLEPASRQVRSAERVLVRSAPPGGCESVRLVPGLQLSIVI